MAAILCYYQFSSGTDGRVIPDVACASTSSMLIRVAPDVTISISGPEPDLARFRNSNPAGAGAGFGDNLFSDHRTIHLMKLMVSSMLSAAIKRQYNSVPPLLHHYLPVFNEISGTAINFVFFLFGYHPLKLRIHHLTGHLH